MKQHSVAVTLICIFMLNGCGEDEEIPIELNGIWEQTGYGDVYVVEKDGAVLYQYTRETCLLANKLKSKAFNKLVTDVELQDDGLAFTARSSVTPAFRVHFSRLKSLPETCNGATFISKAAPTQTFEHLWHTFNDYYAFFAERDVDWKAQYRAHREQVVDDMSNRALFSLLSKMLSPIDDAHIVLSSSSKEFSPSKLTGHDVILSEGFQNQSVFEDFDDYEAAQIRLYNKTLLKYLDEDSIQGAGGIHDSLLLWGTIKSRVGYLRIRSMESIASNPGESVSDDIEAVQAIMDQVLNDLRDTDAMVIDVRFNDGGNDAVSLAIASRFTDTRRLAMTKTARSYRGETTPREAYLVPQDGKPFSKPVAVITGPDTISAAEIFVLAMRALPQVIQVGELTRGVLSDELEKSLPNGWMVTLSNEVYYDHIGTSYEAKGIPPHIKASVFSLNDLEAGQNSALDTALDAVLP
ncbi:MAG: S41 family peptidase [Gammaproteobacteria bacterium]